MNNGLCVKANMIEASLLFNENIREIQRPASLFDQHFGLGMVADDLIHPHQSLVGPMRNGYYRPWRYHPAQRSGQCRVKEDSLKFKICLDVQQFTPEEIAVKTVDFIVVEGKHEEREDEHGFISRHFKRKYKLPVECNPETVQSSLSSDGILTITAPTNPKEKIVPIMHTNTPALKLVADPEYNDAGLI